MRKRLYKIIFETDTRNGRRFDIFLLYAILGSVFVVVIESTPDIGTKFKSVFNSLEWFFTIVFTIELLVRLWVSPKPLRYLFSFWGIIDFIAILPTYLSFFHHGIHYLLVIRMLRLLRVFRILKLVRYSSEARTLLTALKRSSYKISVFLFSVLTVVSILGTLMYVVEGENSGYSSIPISIYWAIVTITTVGYGDIVPLTVLGKFLSAISMIIGYAIIAVPTGIITVELSKTQKEIIICPKCDNSNPKHAKYCNNCGEELPFDIIDQTAPKVNP